MWLYEANWGCVLSRTLQHSSTSAPWVTLYIFVFAAAVRVSKCTLLCMDVICFKMTPTNAVCLNAACYVEMKIISSRCLSIVKVVGVSTMEQSLSGSRYNNEVNLLPCVIVVSRSICMVVSAKKMTEAEWEQVWR